MYHHSSSISTQDAFDIVGRESHMNLIHGRARQRVLCSSVTEHATGSRNAGVRTSRGIQLFPLSHARDK